MTTTVLNTKSKVVDEKILHTFELITTAVRNVKPGKVQKKNPDVSNLSKKIEYDDKRTKYMAGNNQQCMI